MSALQAPGVVLADPADPRYIGLPFSDGQLARFVVESPTPEAARWSENLLGTTGWAIHRVGSARYLHGPNGARWIFAVLTAGTESPAWLDRLLTGPRRRGP